MTTQRSVRVLFLDHVPRMSGAEQSLADLVVGLAAGPVEPVVVLPEDGPLAAELRANGVLVRMVPMDKRMLETSRAALGRNPFVAVLRVFAFLRAGLRLHRLIREVDPVIVHTNTLKSHLLAILPCTLARVPMVWHMRDILPKGWLRRAFLWCSRFAAVIIVPSRAVAEPFRGHRRIFRKVRLIPNGIRVADYQLGRADRSLREMMPVKSSDPVIGLVGRIAPWKGQEIFIRAAAMLAARHPRAHFAVIGAVLFPENDAPFEAYLHRRVVDLGIADRVSFLGWQPAPEAMAACDIVVHASLEPEPFGRTLIEAMAAGKPIVAAQGGATAEIVPPSAGVLVPPGRADLLADALDRLLADRKIAKRMGEAGASVADNFFPIERTIHSVAQIYRAVSARSARRRKRRRPSQLSKVRAARKQRAVKAKAAVETVAFGGWPVQGEPARFIPPQGPPHADEAPAWTRDAARNGRAAPAATPDDDVEMPRNGRAPAPSNGRAPAPRHDAPAAPSNGRAPAPRGNGRARVAPSEAPAFELDEDGWSPPPAPRRHRGRTAPPVHGPAPRRTPGARAVALAATPAPARSRTAPIYPDPDLLEGELPGHETKQRIPLADPQIFAPRPAYDLAKRALDLLVAGAILLLGSPLWLLVAIAIKLESRGPLFHRGTVYGQGCKPFRYYKFRSMRVDGSDKAHRRFIERYVRENGGLEADGEVIYKLLGDDRVTAVGRFIRKLSVDEIPQLWNVVRGEMSIVGPRPPLDYEYELYDEAMKQRLMVKPGITGLQQVWSRHMASFEDKLRMDLNYIRGRSLWMDVKLILRTIPAMVRGG